MILYLEEQLNKTYKEYRYHHMQNKCEYLNSDEFRNMFEGMMQIIYSYEGMEDE